MIFFVIEGQVFAYTQHVKYVYMVPLSYVCVLHASHMRVFGF